MAKATHHIVGGDESDIHDEPHIAGRRITVRQIAGLVEDDGRDPSWVAENYDLPIADVYRALTYFHDHPDEMAAVERMRRRREREARERGAKTFDEVVDDGS